MIVKKDCRYFRGDIPCRPHKEKGIHCEDCSYYSKSDKRILIIKLGAIGDVIRTTPLIGKLKKEYPDSEIYWLTYCPAVVPKSVEFILDFKLENITYLQSVKFDLLINMDKDREACALAEQIRADIKKGFTLEDGRCVPVDNAAHDKWLTGLFDDVNKANSKSYPEEIFEICGFKFNKEQYILDVEQFDRPTGLKKPIIGLNTGCGSRWPTRLWSIDNWIELAKMLKEKQMSVLLLGGEDEHRQNTIIAEKADVSYLGVFPVPKFLSLVNEVDLIVSLVTFSLHVAIALKKKVVLLNNIFNKNEFELYDRGVILQPPLDCLGCFKTRFDSDCKSSNCMDMISPEQVLDAVVGLL